MPVFRAVSNENTEIHDGSEYLGTSPDVPGLVAEGRSVAEAVEISQGLARKIVESCLEHGDPLPRVFRNKQRPNQEYRWQRGHSGRSSAKQEST